MPGDKQKDFENYRHKKYLLDSKIEELGKKKLKAGKNIEEIKKIDLEIKNTFDELNKLNSSMKSKYPNFSKDYKEALLNTKSDNATLSKKDASDLLTIRNKGKLPASQVSTSKSSTPSIATYKTVVPKVSSATTNNINNQLEKENNFYRQQVTENINRDLFEKTQPIQTDTDTVNDDINNQLEKENNFYRQQVTENINRDLFEKTQPIQTDTDTVNDDINSQLERENNIYREQVTDNINRDLNQNTQPIPMGNALSSNQSDVMGLPVVNNSNSNIQTNNNIMGAFSTPNTLPANNPTVGDLIDTTLISTSTPEGYIPTPGYEQNLINQYNKQFAPQEIGAQPLGSLYPGLNHNINVGGYSGQVIGSGNIYVPGGNIMALNPVLERRKAIDDAARKRAAEISKPFESPKTPQFTDQKFQQRLNKDYNGFIGDYMSKAKSLYGDNWKVILQDQNTKLGREFQQGLQNYETTVKNLNQVTDMVATIEKGLADNTLYLSPEKRKVYDEYKKMLGSFSDYETFSKQDIGQLHSILMAERDLNDYFNKSGVMANLEAKVSEYSKETDQGMTYVTKEGKTTDWSGVKKDLARELKQTTLRDSSFSEKDIYDALDARLKNQTSSKTSITEKSQAGMDATQIVEIAPFGNDKAAVVDYNTYNPDGSINPSKKGSFVSKYSHDMNVQGKVNTFNIINDKGEVVQVKSRGLRLDNPVIINGNKEQTIEGSSYGNISGVQTLEYVDEKGNKKTQTVANMRLSVPTQIPKKDSKGKVIKGEFIEGYKEIEVPVVMSSHTQKEIRNAIKDEKMNEAWVDAIEKANSYKTKPSSGNNVQGDNSDPLGLGL